MAAFIETKLYISSAIRIRIGKDIPVMANDEKKTEPLTLTPEILRKMALSGKSLPPEKPVPPRTTVTPEKEDEVTNDGDR
jgi:hypothetical protein